MARVIAGDVVQATMVCRAAAQNGLCVWHYSAVNQLGLGCLDTEVAGGLDQFFAPLIKTLMSTGANYVGFLAQILKPIKSEKVAAVGSAGPGTTPTEVLPFMACGLLSVKTGFGDRTKRGRKYIPFPAEGDNNAAGAPLAGYLTKLDAFAAELLTKRNYGAVGNSVDLVPVVLSRKTGLVTPITQILSRKNWATQRRRSQSNRSDQPIP